MRPEITVSGEALSVSQNECRRLSAISTDKDNAGIGEYHISSRYLSPHSRKNRRKTFDFPTKIN